MAGRATVELPRRNWRDVPVPKRMRALARDRRGLPIPFIVFRDQFGDPHFTINDEERRKRAVHERRCGICGSRIKGALWFVGGPGSAFHERGAYLDGALDHECMNYAVQVCPYLAMPSYSHRIDLGSLDTTNEPHRFFFDPTQDPKRPTVFVAVAARSQTLGNTEDRRSLMAPAIRPERPYVGVEFWRSGVRLSDDDGLAICREQGLDPMASMLGGAIVR